MDVEGFNKVENGVAEIVLKTLCTKDKKELSKNKLIDEVRDIAKKEYDVGRPKINEILIKLTGEKIIGLKYKGNAKIHKLTEKGIKLCENLK